VSIIAADAVIDSEFNQAVDMLLMISCLYGRITQGTTAAVIFDIH